MPKYLKIYNETAQGGYTTSLSEAISIVDEFREGEVGEKWNVTVIEMSEEEYEALPEFEGY
jgi:hypothetical protein